MEREWYQNAGNGDTHFYFKPPHNIKSKFCSSFSMTKQWCLQQGKTKQNKKPQQQQKTEHVDMQKEKLLHKFIKSITFYNIERALWGKEEDMFDFQPWIFFGGG